VPAWPTAWPPATHRLPRTARRAAGSARAGRHGSSARDARTHPACRRAHRSSPPTPARSCRSPACRTSDEPPAEFRIGPERRMALFVVPHALLQLGGRAQRKMQARDATPWHDRAAVIVDLMPALANPDIRAGRWRREHLGREDELHEGMPLLLHGTAQVAGIHRPFHPTIRQLPALPGRRQYRPRLHVIDDRPRDRVHALLGHEAREARDRQVPAFVGIERQRSVDGLRAAARSPCRSPCAPGRTARRRDRSAIPALWPPRWRRISYVPSLEPLSITPHAVPRRAGGDARRSTARDRPHCGTMAKWAAVFIAQLSAPLQHALVKIAERRSRSGRAPRNEANR